ncbi:acyltransferase family protein [Bacteroidota bacterium]
MKTRIYFLDNLRTFLIFLVIILHAGMSYVSGMDSFWIVSDPDKLDTLSLVNMYLDLFVMFIMFFISGYFIPNSIKSKNDWEFIKSKFKRILLPWIIAVFTLIPAYKAIFLFSRGLPQEEWFSYFHFFQRMGSDLSFFANNPTQNWLWFLPALFLCQVLYLILSKINLLSIRISLKTGIVLTFTIGVIYSLIISLSGLKGWTHSPFLDFQRERLLIYFMVFLLGSLCYKLHVFESEKKNKKYYIISNVLLTLSLGVFTAVALNLFFNIIYPARNYFFVSEPIDKLMYYVTALLSMLSFLYILIYVFRFHFNKSNWLMDQLNKNSYQVYIIHMIILGIIAMILVYLPVPAFVKYFILAILTFVVSNIIIYEYKRFLQNNILLRTIALVVLVATLFAFINYGNKDKISGERDQVSSSQNSILPPDVGLHKAVLQGDIESVRQHIAAGSNLDEKEPSGGSSPLITAALFGKTEVARTLIEGSANVNFKNNEGSTPLHTAAFFCRTEIVEALLANGADKNIRNNAGSTALESVTAPFEAVRSIYDYFGKTFGPIGLDLDYKQIKTMRPIIADMLQKNTSK